MQRPKTRALVVVVLESISNSCQIVFAGAEEPLCNDTKGSSNSPCSNGNVVTVFPEQMDHKSIGHFVPDAGKFYWGSESGEPKGFNPACPFEIFTAFFVTKS